MKFWLLNIHMIRRLFSDDAVFLEDEKERDECVMSEMGIIYHGAYDDISERNWNYGQVGEKANQELPRLVVLTEHFLFSLVQLWSPGCLSVHHGQV